MRRCAQYEIIWINYAMNVAIRLIIWLQSHESSRMIARFWEHFFKRIVVLQVFFLVTWSHIMTQCGGFPIFWFFWIFYARFKMRSKRQAWPFLANGWILDFLMFLWLNRYLCTYKCFLEKIKSKLQGSYCSNLTRFLLNRRIFLFFTRGGSKLFTPNHLVNCALNMS